MSGRNYSAGTRAALMSLCRGTCYKPECPEPVVLIEDGEPVLRLDIAHICAENEGGPRYDETLDDPDVFTNLLLLCRPHHKLIDQIKPARYSVEILVSWKRNREGEGLAALQGIRGLTEEQFQEMISDSFEAMTEKMDDALRRFAEIDLEAAEMLRHLRDDLVESIPAAIDPDLASMLHGAGEQLATLWDTAPILLDAATRLEHLAETAASLNDAAQRLARATENTDGLNQAADLLQGIPAAASQLAWAAEQLSDLPDQTSHLAQVIERWRRSRPEQ